MKTNFHNQEGAHSPGGFTLVEILTMISIIFVIAAFAIPRIGSFNDSASKATAEHNAQNIVSMYTAGKDGGQIKWDHSSREACVQDVVDGRTATAASMFPGMPFRVPGLSGPKLASVFKYIGMDAKGDLFFDKEGRQPDVQSTTFQSTAIVSATKRVQR